MGLIGKFMRFLLFFEDHRMYSPPYHLSTGRITWKYDRQTFSGIHEIISNPVTMTLYQEDRPILLLSYILIRTSVSPLITSQSLSKDIPLCQLPGVTCNLPIRTSWQHPPTVTNSLIQTTVDPRYNKHLIFSASSSLFGFLKLQLLRDPVSLQLIEVLHQLRPPCPIH